MGLAPNELDADSATRIVDIIRTRGEPLPIELIAQRFYEAERAREVLPYLPDHSYLVGQRVAWERPSFGRLIGDITSCEFVAGHWRILVDWDARLSPGLSRYLESRPGIRLAYLINPAAPPPRIGGDAATVDDGGASPTVAQLLERDLEDDLRSSTDFVSWAGLWAPFELLPVIDDADLETACVLATLDDGVAQTNEILDVLKLPGPNEEGHGFAALQVNLKVQSNRSWVWGGPRDGGQWLPRERLMSAANQVGPVPRLEDDLRLLRIPDLADEALPEPLGDMVAEVTIRGLDVSQGIEQLEHPISTWEGHRGLFVFDQVEFAFFPSQSMITLRSDGWESTALILSAERVVVPETDAAREAIGRSAIARFERIASTDEFRVDLEPREVAASVAVGGDHELLVAVLSLFSDGEAHNADEAVRHVRTIFSGDVATLTRAVAAILAGYECFDSSDGWVFAYHPDLPHAPRLAGRSTTIGALAIRSAKTRVLAIAEDRRLRRFRAEGLRSPHMVRGHLRKIRRSEAGNPIQVALARMHGINVPRGYTFVRPHERRR